MSASRRTRLSVIAAVASGALVVAMAGTALAAGHADRPSCSPCASVPTIPSADAEDDGTPATTPAAVARP